jgi:hypothetical protein
MPLYHSQPFRVDDANPKTPISITVKQRPSRSVTRYNAGGARGVVLYPAFASAGGDPRVVQKKLQNEPKLDPGSSSSKTKLPNEPEPDKDPPAAGQKIQNEPEPADLESNVRMFMLGKPKAAPQDASRRQPLFLPPHLRRAA